MQPVSVKFVGLMAIMLMFDMMAINLLSVSIMAMLIKEIVSKPGMRQSAQQ